MQLTLRLALLVIGAALFSAGCGTPGAPRPPSLELPRPVSDLAATRVGDRVTLTWTVPRETTDRTNIRHPGPTRICRGVDQVAMVTCTQIGEAPALAGGTRNQPVQAAYTDVLPIALQRQHPTGFATYAVEALNDRGKSAGLSNQVEVPLAPTLPPPADVRAEVTRDGIVLTWTGVLHEHEAPELGHFYRIYRRTPEAPAETVIGEIKLTTDPHAEFVDRTFEWEKTYLYRVAIVTTVERPGAKPVEVSGEPSPELQVVAKDVFPPATPAGLQAVASGVGQSPFVDLTWAPNTESDLAGYNVYRHEAGQPAVKINTELVKAPAYRDSNVQRGHKYFYAVTAVDLRGNESPRSDEASESVP
jgi:hypothetical protein